jgi:hypothetical protein
MPKRPKSGITNKLLENYQVLKIAGFECSHSEKFKVNM